MANGKLVWLVWAVLGLGVLGCSAAPDDPMGPEEETAEMEQALCTESDLTASTSLATSRSSVAGTNTADKAIDNNTGTRWESAFSDPQWMQVDLGASKYISRVRIDWETASAKDYAVQVSADGAAWTTVATRANMVTGNHRIDNITGLTATGRYVRINGTARTTAYGYSIWELDVYGDNNTGCAGTSCTPTTCAAQGKNCGSINDGCGTTLNCGTCGSGQTCSAANVCQASAGCTSNDLTASAPPTLVSSASSGNSASAFDNNTGSRWESTHGVDPQWIQVDLGASKFVNRVNISWEAANAKDYSVRISNDVNFGTYTTLISKTNMASGARTDDLTGLSGSGRYVRVHGTARNLTYGYSIWEMNVYGDSNASCGGTGCGSGQTYNISGQCVTESCGGGCGMGQKCVSNACVNDTTAGAGYYNSGKSLEAIPAGFFGSNLRVYKHDTSAATITNEIQAAYTAQRDAQFGTRRDGFLFAPGTYAAELDIGYGTQISGLGDHPDTVTMTGALLAFPPTDLGTDGTQTVWRSIENFKHGNPNTSFLWAVSQGAPMRRVHATGLVSLHFSWGWQSGGFIADSAVDGSLHFGSQQQFYTRNSQLGTGEEGVWSIVYQGVTGNKTQAAFPDGPQTDIASSPVIREKPLLYVNRDGLFKVFVPALRSNAVGTSWSASSGGSGTSIPLSSFYVAKEGVDTSTTMNNALASGKHLLLTPGVYYLDAPLAVNAANTVVLGIGLATLVPNNGVNAINVADVDGVKIAGILIDAGTGNSDTLIQVGPAGSNASHAGNPTSLHDIFTRIGGRSWIAKAKKSLVVNSNDVIIDHIWLWRADHGANVGWTLNTAQNGLVVNGGRVTAYGTHVEHFQEYQVKWNGNNGKNYFFQSELPYEAPSQIAYDDPPNAAEANTGHGYASYKVADVVTSHELWGGNCHAVFTMNDCTAGSQCSTGVCEANGKCAAPTGGMQASTCFEAPDAQAGVRFRNVLGASQTAKGKINNLINSDGNVATPSIANITRTTTWH